MPLLNDMRYQHFQDWLVKKITSRDYTNISITIRMVTKEIKKLHAEMAWDRQHFKVLVNYWQYMKRKPRFYHEKLQRIGPCSLTIKRYSDAKHA